MLFDSVPRSPPRHVGPGLLSSLYLPSWSRTHRVPDVLTASHLLCSYLCNCVLGESAGLPLTRIIRVRAIIACIASFTFSNLN